MIKFVLLILLTVALLLANLFFGAVHISPEDVFAILSGDVEDDDALGYIVLGSRLPQALTALLAGGGLGLTGLMLQTAFRNPLAGPSILGISSGASLGVAVVMLFLGGALTVGSLSVGGYAATVAGALVGSLAVMGLLIMISSVVKNNLMLLIAGIMIGYLASSVVTLLSSFSTAQGIQGYVFWGMGSFGDVSLRQLPCFSGLTIFAMVLSLALAKPLNLLLLGDNYARNLGVRIKLVRNLLLVSTGLLTAVITAFCGPVSFIGMAIPHVARFYFRSDNHWILMPATILLGAVMGLACNVVSVLPGDLVIPLNALTAILGVPVILSVIFKRRKE